MLCHVNCIILYNDVYCTYCGVKCIHCYVLLFTCISVCMMYHSLLIQHIKIYDLLFTTAGDLIIQVRCVCSV